MKKYSLIILFSFFFLINNVHAEYYITPNTFTMTQVGGGLQYDYYGVNNGNMSNVYQLNGNQQREFSFELLLDGSNCANNIDSSACVDTIHAIEEGGVSKSIYGYFSMCVSKPQFQWSVNWNTCNDNCLKKSQDLLVVNTDYKSCTLGLYDTETGTNMTNDGYLVNVWFDITKWEYLEGAYSGRVNGRIYLDNNSDSILYYRFVNDVLLSDINQGTSYGTFQGVFNHDYSNPDIGGETFLNDGTCVFSYNKMNNYSYTNNWNRDTSTLTFNNNLPYEKLPGGINLYDKYGNFNYPSSSVGGNYTSLLSDGTIKTISNWSSYRSKGIQLNLQKNTNYTISGNLISSTGNVDNFGIVQIMGYNGNWNNIGVKLLNNIGDFNYTFNSGNYTDWFVSLNSNGNTGGTYYAIYDNIQVEKGSYVSDYMPYGGYYVSYSNLQAEMAIFHYYDTNLYESGNIYIYYDNYDNDYELIDMVNCSNSYVCRYENIYSFSHLTNILNPSKDWVNNIKIYWTGTNSIYFEKPYIYDLYEVPGRATWKEYYMPAGTYICSNNENGTYYNAQNKEVYYNPDNPPKIVSSNPNGQSQNIFGIEVNFYGLSGLFNIPIQIINNIKNGTYNNCQPLDIPFPGFPDKHLYMPCMTSFVYNRYPVFLSIYRVILYGVISLKIGIGTLKYIKKWYDGTIESGD